MNLARLEDIEFSAVEKETPSGSVEVTEKPVERGQDIADHIKPKPIFLTINGVVVGDDAGDKLAKLNKYKNEGKLLTYTGRNIFYNVVIEQLDTTHDKGIANGFSFTMTLKHVRIAEGKTINIKKSNLPPKVNIKTKKKEKKGKKQTKKKKSSKNSKKKLKQKVSAAEIRKIRG
ncbi:hypothetical protein SAMN00017405_0383 [Desulfonispora thiosulfatigenes DSM 11270]|uniref:Dit-like phage tail protein N-terminal domain-containing protein n=1 Tax=Desulfonispora thiosulfatigenes DSM 11270 TaxID=656914 RepID=A0A1W1VQY6_DESTI|nr:hypothetical protein [Desulfonispora thiosulfatigenes]SMB95334.1 hypothetical protein SAMN00017405_0383 [Desulfonispora thiosulfatigenes DSM 11270]